MNEEYYKVVVGFKGTDFCERKYLVKTTSIFNSILKATARWAQEFEMENRAAVDVGDDGEPERIYAEKWQGRVI